MQVLTPPVFRKRYGRYVTCMCLCGSDIVKEVRVASLVASRIVGCGCIRHERATKSNTKHSMVGTGAYKSWQKMRDRCHNTGSEHFERYGGRGIKVCERWNDFANFYADMGDRPAGMTLERVDYDGDYEPSNCKWAPWTEQARNTSRTRLSPEKVLEIRARYERGESQPKLAKAFCVSNGAIWSALHGRTWADVTEA